MSATFLKAVNYTMNIKALFDAAAQDYDCTQPQYIPCFDEFYSTALGLIPHDNQANLKVLDIGAGTGLLSGLVSAAFPNAAITLTDISSEMLGKARERFNSNPNSFSLSAIPASYPINATVVRPRPMQTVARALTSDSRCTTPAPEGEFSSHCCP